MAEDILRLGQFESKAIVALETRPVGVYIQKMAVAGNSILSTVFVESRSEEHTSELQSR